MSLRLSLESLIVGQSFLQIPDKPGLLGICNHLYRTYVLHDE
jgi:hypothetical protein